MKTSEKSVFANSKWLTFPECDACLTRTVFSAKNIKSATLYITGLGYFEAYTNGSKVSNEHFIPAMTDYEKRDLSKINMPIFDTLSHRIYYHSYDITASLQEGKNVLCTHIGAGWYGQHESQNEGMPYWGDNCLVFSIKIVHGNDRVTYVNSSEKNTVWRKSYILESSLYFGEYHDARKYPIGWKNISFDDSDWKNSTTRTAPESQLSECDFPTDKTIRTIEPELIYEFGDRKIYDFKELAAGYAVIEFTERACTNERATVRYADELNPDGSLQFYYCGGTQRMQRDHFVFDAKAKNQEFHPHFTWHAARYAEITGLAEIKRFEVIQTDIKQVATFKSDNETLQWIFDAYVRTQTANIHGCIPSDCPHRERLGYTGDGQLTCGAVMTVFDARKLYKKWIADIWDCQDKENGHVQHTAPFYGGGGGPGGWGGAAVIVPYRYYMFYNDISILEESYDSMKAYIKYMQKHSKNGIVVREEPNGWCLGDWCPPKNKVTIPETFVNTYFLAKCTEMLIETAEILNQTEDAKRYKRFLVKTKKAIIENFFDNETESFCGAQQGADAFAIDINLGTEKTKKNLVEKYSKLLSFDTGIFGTYLLIKVLFKINEGSLAYKLLVNETENSFYNMKKHGATTLWENWDGCDSRCHPMFGAVVELFFSELLGIKNRDNKPGFNNPIVEPPYIPEIGNIKGSMTTKWGTIYVSASFNEETQCFAKEVKLSDNYLKS